MSKLKYRKLIDEAIHINQYVVARSVIGGFYFVISNEDHSPLFTSRTFPNFSYCLMGLNRLKWTLTIAIPLWEGEADEKKRISNPRAELLHNDDTGYIFRIYARNERKLGQSAAFQEKEDCLTALRNLKMYIQDI